YLEELLKLHRQHLVARDLELAGKEELHAVGLRILVQLLEVLGADRDRAVSAAWIALYGFGAAVRHVDVPLPAAFAGDVDLVLRADLLGVIRILLKRGRKIVIEELLDVDGHGSVPPERLACRARRSARAGMEPAGKALLPRRAGRVKVLRLRSNWTRCGSR